MEPAILRRSVTSLSCGLADLCTSQSPVGDSTAGEQHKFLNKRTTKDHTRNMTQKSPKHFLHLRKFNLFALFSSSSTKFTSTHLKFKVFSEQRWAQPALSTHFKSILFENDMSSLNVFNHHQPKKILPFQSKRWKYVALISRLIAQL